MRELKVGDKIRCIKRFKNIQIGTEITISGYRDKLYYAGELLGYCCQGFLNEHFELVEELSVQTLSTIDWEQRRYELSKVAMQSLLPNLVTVYDERTTAKLCIKIANEMIKQLKEDVK